MLPHWGIPHTFLLQSVNEPWHGSCSDTGGLMRKCANQNLQNPAPFDSPHWIKRSQKTFCPFGANFLLQKVCRFQKTHLRFTDRELSRVWLSTLEL